MNSRKVRYSCFLVCLSVLLGSSWTAPAAAGDAADLRLAAGPPGGLSPQERAEAAAKSKGPTFDPKAPAPPPGTVLETHPFALGSGNVGNAISFYFVVPGPGQVILTATTIEPQNQLGLMAQRGDPAGNGTWKWTNIRKDGPTPLRLELTATAQNLADGSKWIAYVGISGPDGIPYKTPPSGARGNITVSFVPDAPAQTTPVPAKQRKLQGQ